MGLRRTEDFVVIPRKFLAKPQVRLDWTVASILRCVACRGLLMRLFTLSLILFAALAKSARGAALALIAVALLATPIQATTIVFFDTFESDTLGGNPAIDLTSGDVGSSWDNEASPGVTMVANPDPTGNVSANVLQLHHKGAMDGNLSTGILYDGATLSTDFYISSDVATNKITMKFRTAAGTGPLNLNLKQNGDVTGGSSVGALAITHYGADVWQSATWSFAYTGTSNFWDVDVAFTNLVTSDTTSNTFNNLALALTTSDVFTEVTPRGQSGGSMYVDNIQVSSVTEGSGGGAVPEPAAILLALLGLALLPRRRRR